MKKKEENETTREKELASEFFSATADIAKCMMLRYVMAAIYMATLLIGIWFHKLDMSFRYSEL